MWRPILSRWYQHQHKGHSWFSGPPSRTGRGTSKLFQQSSCLDLKMCFTDQQENVEIAAAVNKLVRFLRSQQLSYVHSALDGAQNERDAFFRTLAREQHSAAPLPSSNSRRMLQGCKPFHTLYISLCTFLHACHTSCIHTTRVHYAFSACALVCVWEKRFS